MEFFFVSLFDCIYLFDSIINRKTCTQVKRKLRASFLPGGTCYAVVVGKLIIVWYGKPCT